jgi:hypothetical protein
MAKNITPFFNNIYAILLLVIFLAFLFFPFLSNLINQKNLGYPWSALFVLILIVGISSAYLYKRKTAKQEKIMSDLEADKKKLESRLDEAFRYIGALNVQVKEIEAVFTKIDRYPETRQEIKKILRYLAEKILSISSADWVIIKIIDDEAKKTLCEADSAREGKAVEKISISNNDLIKGRAPYKYSLVESSRGNFATTTYCILPKKISANEKILIKGIANQAEMLFLIFTSIYYRSADKNPLIDNFNE